MSEDRKDKGWEYLQNDGAEGSFYEDDGSWGSQNSDGSGSYYGADGSWGTKNADGSASFYGADGKLGYTKCGWKISYYGKDGTWGYKNADGSGAYYSGSDSDNSYYDADESEDDESSDSDESSSGDLSDALAGLFTVALELALRLIPERSSRKEKKPPNGRPKQKEYVLKKRERT